MQEVSERANALAQSVQLANQAIHEEAGRNPSWVGMGSTLVAVLIEGGLFSIVNLGDSRIYLIRDGNIQQLTTDHSLVMEQVRRGFMTAEEAEHSDMQNVIVRALGSEDNADPDLADHELVAGDVLLLCCDGLTRQLKDSSILQIVIASRNLNQTCSDLIEAAKQAGSDDNITCLLIRVVPESWLDKLFGMRKRRSQNSV